MLKSRLSTISRSIPVLIIFLTVTIPSIAKYSGGTGEPNNPYQISDANDWVQLMNTSADWNKNFIMTADIDVNGISLKPVGQIPPAYIIDTAKDISFTGVFNGKGHTIYNADVNMPNNNYIGLFGYVCNKGRITNICAENVKIFGRDNVGGLVGGINDHSNVNITNCYSTGTVKGRDQVGGLVGDNYGVVTDCYSKCTVSGNDYIGGLVGRDHKTITNCYSNGTVKGQFYIGGLVGLDDGTVTNCYSKCVVNGQYDSVGGLVGNNYGTITNCYSIGTVNGHSFVGGLVGWNYRIITHCYSNVMINGDFNVGGLVGFNREFGTITNCYSTSTVSGKSYIGGFVGFNIGDVNDCYCTGAVSGKDYVGGLVGYHDDRFVTNCYSTGTVDGQTHLGGLVGENTGTVTKSFWNINTSGRTNSAGGTGKTTEQMQKRSTFTNDGWDFMGETKNGSKDIWRILEGKDYPRLKWQLPVDDFQ